MNYREHTEKPITEATLIPMDWLVEWANIGHKDWCVYNSRTEKVETQKVESCAHVTLGQTENDFRYNFTTQTVMPSSFTYICSNRIFPLLSHHQPNLVVCQYSHSLNTSSAPFFFGNNGNNSAMGTAVAEKRST